MVFEVEGRDYIALTPATEEADEVDEVEVTMFRYDADKDEDMLEDIESEEELDKVYEAFDEIFESEEFQAAIEE